MCIRDSRRTWSRELCACAPSASVPGGAEAGPCEGTLVLAVLVKAQTAPVALLGCGEIVSSLDSAVDYGTRVDAPKIISQQHLPSEAAHGLQRKQQRQELLTVVCTESPAVSWAMLRRCSVHERRTNTPLSGFLLTREYLSHPAAFFLHWLDSFISVCVPYPLYLPSHPTDDLYDICLLYTSPSPRD